MNPTGVREQHKAVVADSVVRMLAESNAMINAQNDQIAALRKERLRILDALRPLRLLINNPSAWERFDQRTSDQIKHALEKI